MTVVAIVVAILIVGFICALVRLAPIDERFQQMIYLVLVFCLVLWLLQGFGVIGTHIQVK